MFAKFFILDDNVVTQNLPEKVEIFRSEKPVEATHWTEPEAAEKFTISNK